MNDASTARLEKIYRLLLGTLFVSCGAFIVDNIMLTFRLMHIVQAVGKYCR